MTEAKLMKNQKISRRQLIAASGAATSLAVLAGCDKGASVLAGSHHESAATNEAAHSATERAEGVAGIQLYTLRDSMAQSVNSTLKAVAGIGYKEVEFAGYFDHSPAELRTMMNDLGLSAPSAHVDPGLVREDPESVIDAAAEVGHRYIVVAWLPQTERATIAQYKAWSEVFNRCGELCAARDMRFAYHNHEFEFETTDGQEPFQVLMDETDPTLVDFELDFYWVKKAGLNINDVLARNPGRFVMAHIKDMDSDGEMVSVGEGTIDFSSVLAAPEAANLKHLFVEHDNPDNSFRSASVSYFNFSKVLNG
jgi:sugar phosphate isomerase/epimerase